MTKYPRLFLAVLLVVFLGLAVVSASASEDDQVPGVSSDGFDDTVHPSAFANRYEQDDSHLEYMGPWVQDVPSPYAASGWSYSYGDQSGCSVKVGFLGTSLTWVTRVTPWSGIAKVVLDAGTPSQVVTMVDTWHWSDVHKQPVYYTGVLTYGAHTVSIYWTGEKNPNSWYNQIYNDAFDIVGNITTTVPAWPMVEWRYQETDPGISYLGDWSDSGDTGWLASGNSYKYTSQAGAMAVIQFIGDGRFMLVGKKCSWYGQATVTIDPGTPSEIVATADFYSPTRDQLWKEVVYQSPVLPPFRHFVVIECQGEPICLDAVDMTGYLEQAPTSIRVDDSNGGFCSYAGPSWSRWDGSGYWAAYQDTYAYTDQNCNTVTVTFNGTFADWVTCVSNTKGKAYVTLDPGPGQQVTVVDLYSPSTQWKKKVYSTGLLDYGTHIIEIECMHQKNPSSWWYTVGADAFDIVPVDIGE